MAVPIEFFSVVVPKQVIQQKYKVGFMDSKSLDEYCEKLIANGFHYDEVQHFSTDFVVVQSLIGKKWKAEWLYINDEDWATLKEFF